MFVKNGQGCYEFDFNDLAELTSEEFAKDISEALESKRIKAVELNDFGPFVSVFILNSGLVMYHSFNKETGNMYTSHVPIHAATWAVEKVRLLNE